MRLLFGELRQGALEAVLLEAVARAGDVPTTAVRRAVMMGGGLATVAHALLADADKSLSRFMVQIFRPVQPMLAQPASGVDEALDDQESGDSTPQASGASRGVAWRAHSISSCWRLNGGMAAGEGG